MIQNRKTSILLLLIIGFATHGCFNDEGSFPKRISLRYTIGDIDQTLTGNSKEIVITEMKFLVGDLKLFTTAEDTLSINVNGLIFSFKINQAGTEETIIEGPTGFAQFDEFEKLDLLVRTAQPDDRVNDPDLFSGPNEEDLFAFVMKGKVNDTSFNIKRKLRHEERFIFRPPVKLNDNLETLKITLITNLQDIFFTKDNPARLLDPTNQEDILKILENFTKSFRIQAEAISQVNL